MTDKKHVMLRLQPEVAEELRIVAKQQKRSVNNLIEVIIDEYLQKIKDQQK